MKQARAVLFFSCARLLCSSHSLSVCCFALLRTSSSFVHWLDAANALHSPSPAGHALIGRPYAPPTHWSGLAATTKLVLQAKSGAWTCGVQAMLTPGTLPAGEHAAERCSLHPHQHADACGCSLPPEVGDAFAPSRLRVWRHWLRTQKVRQPE